MCHVGINSTCRILFFQPKRCSEDEWCLRDNKWSEIITDHIESDKPYCVNALGKVL